MTAAAVVRQASLEEHMAKKQTRVVHTFQMPKGLDGEIKSIGLVELTPEEESNAYKRSFGDSHKFAYEMAKACVAQVNGQNVSLAEGETDTLFNKMSPKQRNLVLAAYAHLHTPTEDLTKNFLQSQTVQVG